MDLIRGVPNSKKRTYVAPACTEKGDIATLTQVVKQFGSSDGIFLLTDQGTVPIGNVS